MGVGGAGTLAGQPATLQTQPPDKSAENPDLHSSPAPLQQGPISTAGKHQQKGGKVEMGPLHRPSSGLRI